ncbi:Troponin domain containing protein-like, partial [Tropilaelaps mercedesae]
MDEAERVRLEHREKLKHEVRKRLEEASKKKKASGFLTAERKKKLKKLLREANQAAVLRELERKTVLRKKV